MKRPCDTQALSAVSIGVPSPPTLLFFFPLSLSSCCSFYPPSRSPAALSFLTSELGPDWIGLREHACAHSVRVRRHRHYVIDQRLRSGGGNRTGGVPTSPSVPKAVGLPFRHLVLFLCILRYSALLRTPDVSYLGRGTFFEHARVTAANAAISFWPCALMRAQLRPSGLSVATLRCVWRCLR